jgi:hypothetical protein
MTYNLTRKMKLANRREEQAKMAHTQSFIIRNENETTAGCVI